jgi:hypothetical protein
MGKEARVRQEQAGATKSFHINEQEAFVLTLYLLNNIQPKDRHEQRRYGRVFSEFELNPIRQRLKGPDQRPVTIDDFHEEDLIEVDVANDTLEYVLEVTDKPMVGLHSLVLLPLQERLIAVKNGAYKSPLSNGVSVSSGNQTGGATTGEMNVAA